MIIVNFFATLRTFLKMKQVRIHADEVRIIDLLQQCETKTPQPFLHKLIDKNGNLIPGTMILVNGQNVINLQGVRTVVRKGANVALFLADSADSKE